MPKTKSSAAVITPPGIASYAFVWKPQPAMTPGQDPKFAITIIIPKTADFKPLRAAVEAAGLKKFGDGYAKLKKTPKFSMPFRDGDVERDGDELYAGKIFFSAKSSQQPRIVDQDLNPITDQFEFYSGARCRISVFAFGFDVNGNKGVTFGLNNIQKLGDGPRLSGRLPPEEEFADAPAGTSDGEDEEDDMFK